MDTEGKMSLPFSPAAARNADPIAEILRGLLHDGDTVLEIGAGTGQHAVHMAGHFPAVSWLPTDVSHNIPTIRARVRAAQLANLREPQELDIFTSPWPNVRVSMIFTANTFHIMPPDGWCLLVKRASCALEENGHLVVYGPFRYADRALEPSNARFEDMLQKDAPHRGIREQGKVVEFAEGMGFVLVADHAMPANNRCLIFRRTGANA